MFTGATLPVNSPACMRFSYLTVRRGLHTDLPPSARVPFCHTAYFSPSGPSTDSPVSFRFFTRLFLRPCQFLFSASSFLSSRYFMASLMTDGPSRLIVKKAGSFTRSRPPLLQFVRLGFSPFFFSEMTSPVVGCDPMGESPPLPSFFLCFMNFSCISFLSRIPDL